MYRLSSSIRTRDAKTSLSLARQVARDLGIMRETDITRLDKPDQPIYADTRPNATTELLNIHNDKGLLPCEAEIGDYMESIEFELAKSDRHTSRVKECSLRDVQTSLPPGLPLSSFSPRFDIGISPDDTLRCVQMTDLISGHRSWIPAELTFHPLTSPGKKFVYGCTSTNGLCSGNSLIEAAVHGVCKLLERDVRTADMMDAHSAYISLSTEPPVIQEWRHKIERTGLTLTLRKTPNAFRLPFYSAFVMKADGNTTVSIAKGYGLHPSPEIAAVRAVTKAIQSHLTNINGGNGANALRTQLYQDNPRASEADIFGNVMNSILSEELTAVFTSPEETIPDFNSVNDLWAILVSRMAEAALHHCFAFQLNPEACPFSVVRMVVPWAEHVETARMRSGMHAARRLKAENARGAQTTV